MKYRIVKKVVALDNYLRTRYHVQCKAWFFFWVYVDNYADMESAEKRIDCLLRREELKKQESETVVRKYND